MKAGRYFRAFFPTAHIRTTISTKGRPTGSSQEGICHLLCVWDGPGEAVFLLPIDPFVSEKTEQEVVMEKIETIQDFKHFLNSNRDNLLEHAIKVEDLPSDDEWIRDDDWDEIYKQEGAADGKI